LLPVIPVVGTACVHRQAATTPGTTTRIAMVQPDPGYSPDPSPPGTGTVLSAVGLAPVFTADSPPSTAPIGDAFGYAFAATGTPAPTFTVASGALPDGLSLDASTGALTGTPTTAGADNLSVRGANGGAPGAIKPPPPGPD